MDIYTFVSKIVDTVAWPIVTLILVFSLRGKFSDFLPFLSKIKAGPVEAEFSDEARKILQSSKEILAKGEDASSENQEADIALAKIYTAKHDPTKMILEGWGNVDGALFRIGRDSGVSVDPMENSDKLYRGVISTDLLEPETKKLVVEIYEMRNRVAHANIKPSVDAAKDYLLAVEQVVKLIEKQRKSISKGA